ncbi:dTDP-4-dehydrorhamnose 3,5-epimerase [Methylocapsa aurea]|uniref:dTDP-4-dehydrorhamnose 3,5-epimerase n=1 Tax=Methylocapsa aurea TaxID=663610 RepID=UPI0005624C68|nr:dTDP-4-dehydrorhamnose 3,5-epimerase [Methylocapsa aurea]
METESFAISGPLLLTPRKFADSRGFFSEVYNQRTFDPLIGAARIVQENHSLSRAQGTVRGLHFQSPPTAQGKLVRVARGAILDVAVDIRRQSPTYGQYVSAALSAENWAQLWIPVGFAHGFCTLEPDTEVIYQVTDYYSQADDKGIAWDDPDIGIDWPIGAANAVLSDKDRSHPRLACLPEYFS